MTSPIPPFSRIKRVVLVIGIVCLVTTFACVIFVGARNDDVGPKAEPSLRARVADRFGRLPLSFEVNRGQIEQQVKFLSNGPGYHLFLTANEAVLSLRAPSADKKVREGSVLRLKMIGANAAPQVEGQDELPGKVNYFTGNDPEKWQRNVPTYRKVFYKDVYPGIDVVYYGNQRELEYDFIVAPGANHKLIKFTVEGADKISLDETGSLILKLKHGEVRLKKPVIYQLTDAGSRREVKGEYVIRKNEIRFKVQAFDSGKPLVIDPVLSYSTLLGSAGNETAFGIAVDSQGNAYVTGPTNSNTFPTTAGAFKTTNDSGGAFVSKLDSTGSTLVYSTYLSTNATGRSIAVDALGNAYVTGNTSAIDFPTINALKANSNFYKTTDSATTWTNNNSGIVGHVNTVAIAPNSPNVIYAGTTSGPFRSTDGGATWTKTPLTGLNRFPLTSAMAVDPGNSSVLYAGLTSGGFFKTTDGGNNWSVVSGPLNFATVFCIAFDPVTPSTIYVGSNNGAFKSTDSGATWTALNFGNTPFIPGVLILAIDPTATSTIYAGTLSLGVFKSTNGGSSWTQMNDGMNPSHVFALAIDPSNPATIYASASFAIYKSTNGAVSWTLANNGVPSLTVNAIVATPSAVYAGMDGGGIVKTTNGGTSWTSANVGLRTTNVHALVGHPTDPTILFAGETGPNFVDAFVTKLNPSGSGLLFSTLLGGTNDDSGNGIAVDGNGNIAIAGSTFSTDFPTVNAIQSDPGPTQFCSTGFVTRLDPSASSYVFSTYLGGNSCDAANGVAVDTSGSVYVVGQTNSSDFPTANAFQDTVGSSIARDAFVTKFTTTGALAYSTYLGGSVDDLGFAIAVDASGNAYVTGTTQSLNFPTLNPIQTASLDGFRGDDVFVTKLNSQGSGLVYSTYLGGSGTDTGRSIAVDSSGNAYVTGVSLSVDFPLTAGALRTRSPIYKSIDEAANWSNDNYGFGDTVVIGIVINPSQPWILYAGTGRGVFKSTDGGRNWSAVNNGLNARQLSAIVIDPLNPSTLYVATNEFNNTNNGIYKTTDGGNSWNLRNTGLPGNRLLSLVIDPVTPTTLYAGMFGTQIYKTDDGADNWVPTPSPLSLEPVALAVDPLNHTKVYVADFSSNGGILRSTNSGTTWQYLASNLTRPGARSISISPVTSGLMYIGTSNGTFKSTDGGDNWSQLTSLSGIAGRIVVDPVSSSTLYYLTETFSVDPGRGVLKSTDGGQTWKPVNKGVQAFPPAALAIDPLKPSVLHLASTSLSGEDAFVTKINPAGSALVYSTFIGGTVNPEPFRNVSAQGFGIAVDSVGNAYVAGLAFATDFPTTPNAFQPFSRGGTEAFISKLSMSYLISGHVIDGSNAPVGGVEVVLSDGSSIASVTTEGDGSYQFSRLREGGTFTVSATKPHFTIAPLSQTFNNLNSDQVVDFTATATNASFFTISGQVTENGVGLAGVNITLSGSQPGLRTTDSNGNYSFELAGGGNYTVTPSRPGFTFATTSQTFNNLSAPQTANFTATRQSFVVTNDNNHGPGSLRDAILNANASDGKDTITFNIPGAGVKVISLTTALPEITDAVVIDGTTQPGYAGSPLIELDGTLTAGASGLVIRAGGSTVKGLAIGNFSSGNGIWLNVCNNNVIQGNYIGVDAAGTTARPNNIGIRFSNSSNNLIGGTTAAARNVISANSFSGIEIAGSGNIVQGNFIGTNAAGTGKFGGSNDGIHISSSQFTNNVIGGTAPGAGNLISGNQTGISTSAPGTIIQGNLIGTDVTGTQTIFSGTGISAFGSDILIGGLTPAARNIISGNEGNGVTLSGSGSKLQGNYIGTDITGLVRLHNGNGVVAGGNALIGGTEPGARNVITGSFIANVSLGFNNTGSAAIVQGNYIGTDATGTRAMSNATNGIVVRGANHLIGGTVPGAGNVISGNSFGIQITGTGNTVQGNLIGLNALGAGGVPNVFTGIQIVDATNNIIGGVQNGAANKIAFNNGPGITVTGTRNSIRGNSVFSNGFLGIDLGADGVTLNDTNDTDTGANLLQNFPVLTSVQSSGGSTTIQGSLKSTPNTKFQIDFYSNAGLDPSGNGEGALFFNTTEVTTNGNGDATINVTFASALPAGRAITATATDPNGNTSEFSAGDESAAGGSVRFSLATFQVIEDVGLATVTVQRTGGSVGNVSVDYATVDGSAIAGQDYTATSGTLNFGNGETSKTIQIPITEDAIAESDETFRVALRTSAVEVLGSPDTMVIAILDGASVPSLFVNNASVVEGGPGTVTQALFTLTLSAATGKTDSVNYATGNSTARGGAACGAPGVDYESVSGTFIFQPGKFTTVIPVKVCGDTSAESNESFVLNLSNPSNATISDNQGVGTIVNDDVLELVLEESGPGINQAAALESNLQVRDPFRVLRIDDWNLQGDRNTRAVLFARNLQLDPGENFSAVNVNVRGSNNQLLTVFPEDVRAVPNTDLTQIVFRLPTTFPPGTVTVVLLAHGRTSNIGSFRIAQ
jgi:photosystem II stability/assembly factor-like uncharacterized protein